MDHAEIYALIGTASLAVVGFFWKTIVTNRDKARRINQINRSFREITKDLTTSINEKERLAAAILLRRFFDENGEFSIQLMRKKETPYAKAALELMTALLKIEVDGPVQKALADSLILSDSLRLADMQGANLAHAYLGRRGAGDNFSWEAGIVLRGVDLYMANLSGASLKQSDCENAVFAKALMRETICDEANLAGANFKMATLNGAKFRKARLINSNFTGADLTDTNFSDADLTGACFDNAILTRANFKGAINPPI